MTKVRRFKRAIKKVQDKRAQVKRAHVKKNARQKSTGLTNAE